MPVIAVVNRKGGSGKSTFAAHVAAWCARQGHSVMLGDVDRQQSSRGWLRRRDPALPAIAPWAMDQKNMLRVPTGITHVVLDTPGGIHGFELARIVMFADAVVMPVCASVFDRESAAACHAELMTLPRVASGRCRLGVVGMRIDGRTRASQVLADWSRGLGLSYLGALRETQLYVRSLERGLTLFDLPEAQATADLAQWEPIIDWMRPLLQPVQAANDPAPATRPLASRVGVSRPESLMPAQESLVHGSRLAVLSGSRSVASAHSAPPSTLTRTAAGQIPQFLKR
ncbi:MAG TPA: ParA family protein [Ramlibacter sp.]|nr:ParA family protein [Ramlibacter sp.]